MKLKIRDIEAEEDKVSEMELIDVIDVAVEHGEEDSPLFQWIRPVHLNDAEGNSDPQVTEHAHESGIDVEVVMSEEIRSASNDIGDKNDTSSDDDDGGGNTEVEQQRLSPFIGEEGFTHATQDEDHGGRPLGSSKGTHTKQYTRKGKGHMTQPAEDSFSASFESMSVSTNHGSYGFDDTTSQISSNYEDGQYGQLPFGYYDMLYPQIGIMATLSRENYLWHVNNYLTNFTYRLQWQQYCEMQNPVGENTDDSFEPRRNSM